MQQRAEYCLTVCTPLHSAESGFCNYLYQALAQITADPSNILRNLNELNSKCLMEKNMTNANPTAQGLRLGQAPISSSCYCYPYSNGTAYTFDARETCGSPASYNLTLVLVAVTSVICFLMSLTNTSLPNQNKARGQPKVADDAEGSAVLAESPAADAASLSNSITADASQAIYQRHGTVSWLTASVGSVSNKLLIEAAESIRDLTLFDW
jgi:hypothetical protein